jgi:hypothetical protein
MKRVLLVLAVVAVLYGVGVFVFLNRQPGTQTVSAKSSEVTNPAENKAALAWDMIKEVNVEGIHFPGGPGEHCEDVTYGIVSGPGTIEVDTQVLKKDDDTHWELNKGSRSATWHICANNCTFSCDEISLRLFGRLVLGANAEKGNEEQKRSSVIEIELSRGSRTARVELTHNLVSDNTWRSLTAGAIGADEGEWTRKQGTDGVTVMLTTSDPANDEVLEILGVRPVVGVGVPFEVGDAGKATHVVPGHQIPGGPEPGSTGQVDWRVLDIH